MKLHHFVLVVLSSASAWGAPWVYVNSSFPRMAAKGLPSQPSRDYYAWHPEGFAPATTKEMDPGRLFVRWSERFVSYAWRETNDSRELMSPSRAQGWRFGLTGDAYYYWFEMDSNGEWIPPPDGRRPCLYRYSSQPECAPDDWVTWVKPKPTEPPPPVVVVPPPAPPPHPVVAPRCKLNVSRGQVRTDESIVLSLEVEGVVTAAEIDGNPVDPKVLKRILSPRIPGFHQALASVTGPGGVGTCWGQYHVIEAD